MCSSAGAGTSRRLAGDQLAGGGERGIAAAPLLDQHPDLARAEAAEPPQVLRQSQAAQGVGRLLALHCRRPRLGLAVGEMGRLRQAAQVGHEVRRRFAHGKPQN